MTSKSYLLGVDVGTSGCKTVLIDRQATVLAMSQAEYELRHPRSGWAEQDPVDWYRAFCQTVNGCLEGAGVSPGEVEALSVTGPAHNAVLLDRSNRVLRPVIHWSDQRSKPQVQWLKERYGDLLFSQTYQPVDPSWTLPQLLWVKQNEPEVWKRTFHILFQKDYIAFKLTGSYKTDPYDAAGSQLLDMGRMEWSEELCEILALDPGVLPKIEAAESTSGRVQEDVRRDCGLAAGTRVAVGSGDSVVEALGIGVVEPGQGIVKLASSGAVNVITADPRPHQTTMTYPHLFSERWYSISATNTGAAAALWFYKTFNLGGDPESGIGKMEHMAAEIEAGSGGVIFHPFLKGERAPYWDPELRADFLGLALHHGLEHLARAVLEGVAFSLRDVRDHLVELDFDIKDMHLLGGGCRSRLWCQIVSEVFGETMPRYAEGATAFGAALIGGVAQGLYEDLEEASLHAMKPLEIVEPNPSSAVIYDRSFSVYRQATDSIRAFLHETSEAR